jgi:chromosome segregation ATPase
MDGYTNKMTFYNQPVFWIFLSTFFGGIFGTIKLYFVWEDRNHKKQFDRDNLLEDKKAGNLQTSIDTINGVLLRLESTMKDLDSTVQKHDVALTKMGEISKVINLLQAKLETMTVELSKRYEEFQRKLTNVTVSFQSTIDRVENVEKKIEAFGKVIKL